MNIETYQLPECPELAGKLKKIADLARGVDGIAPLSEQFILGLDDARLEHTHLVLSDAAEPVGLAAVAGDDAEMFIHPDYRGRGWGNELLNAVRAIKPAANVWAHGNLPAAQAVAQKNHMEKVRQLLVMEVAGKDLAKHSTLGDAPYTPANFTDSVERWGTDLVEQEWVRANNEAFSWHPEQGGWDIERLHRGMEAEWFDPADVLFYWDTKKDDDGAAPVLAGFHWTKWHKEETDEFGEVYVIGISKAYRGQGLGNPLLRYGLNRMVEKGADRVILYVEADNKPAVKLYERLGFSVIEDHSVYSGRD